MGFCRRCGDIVVGPRCKCGGMPVAPVVKWDHGERQPLDKWSRTYVTSEKPPPKSISRLPEAVDRTNPTTKSSTSAPTRSFPRPLSTVSNTPIALGSRVTAHIASTAISRPSSPLKYSAGLHDQSEPSTSANAAAGILPNPNGSELAKVYGSVLQPKESLASYHCAMCFTQFAPDATIYPEPLSLSSSSQTSESPRFLCRACFTEHGGSKGDCEACQRPVLVLKSEGGFVENGGRIWHKKCFRCDGCAENIGDNPMVDLLGRPSCANCFESCLTRSKDNPHQRTEDDNVQKNTVGGVKRHGNREGSPALEELQQRLGIVRSRESTPAMESRTTKSSTGMTSPVAIPFTDRSPLAGRYTSRAADDDDRSPVMERLMGRKRTNSSALAETLPPSAMEHTSPLPRKLQDAGSQSPAGAALDSPSPRRPYRYHTSQQDPSMPDSSPMTRRNYTSVRSPEPDVFTSIPAPRASIGSPRYGSPAASKQPSQAAIDEMKQRFLRQTSPTPTSTFVLESSPSSKTTPTRRSSSRPRISQNLAEHLTGTGTSPADSRGRSMIPRPETSSSAPPSEESTELDAALRVLRRDRTGDAEVESLLGTEPFVPMGDLIDLGPTSVIGQLSSPQPTSPMSRIPLSTDVNTSLPSSLVVRTDASEASLRGNYDQSVPSTPDLAGDFSDTTSNTQSSAPSTPPSVSPPGNRSSRSVYPKGDFLTSDTSKQLSDDAGGPSEHHTPDAQFTTPTPKSKRTRPDVASPTPLPADARCAKCSRPLFATKYGGKFVTVPEEPSTKGVPPKTYHISCFRCKVCDGVFEGGKVVVRSSSGDRKALCAPPEKTKVRQVQQFTPASHSVRNMIPTTSRTITTAIQTNTPSSSRYERPPPSAPATTREFTFPRFGGSTSCPGCDKAVSPMERGVVPGPQGSRWHATCLICGGKDAKGRRKEDGKPGCGKKLDSAAKTDIHGQVWCRECLLLLPTAMRNPSSPVRPPLVASHTGGHGVTPQYTGTTTIARQFTGVGRNADASVLRQLTGGGLSPTRQLSSSPTKLYDGPRPASGRSYPRPKSVTGVRSTKSDGEGRGMFLVRQLTGGNAGLSGNDYGL